MKHCPAAIIFFVTFLCQECKTQVSLTSRAEAKKLLVDARKLEGSDQDAGTSMCFMKFPVPKTWDLRYNGSILSHQPQCNFTEYFPVFYCDRNLWLSPIESGSSVNLTFYPNATTLFNYTAGQFFQDFVVKLHCYGNSGNCSHSSPSQPEGNGVTRIQSLPWILFGVVLSLGGLAVVTVLLILVCKNRLCNKGTDKKKAEPLKFSTQLNKPNSGSEQRQGESKENVPGIPEQCSPNKSGPVAIGNADHRRGSKPRQHDISRSFIAVIDIEPRRQSEETERPKPESYEPPKEIPRAGPTDNETPRGLPMLPSP